MLDLNPKNRISVNEAIKHSFFEKDIANNEEVCKILMQ